MRKGQRHTKETRQKMSENHADVSGKNHWNWKDGRSSDAEYKRQCAKQRYLDNREYWKKYQQNNKAKITAWVAKREARKRNQTPDDANQNSIQKIYSYCQHLNETGFIKYHVDHIIPLFKGGLHHEDNLQILMARDNMKKQDKITDKYKGLVLKDLK